MHNKCHTNRRKSFVIHLLPHKRRELHRIEFHENYISEPYYNNIC
jgi:hypothetical protein